ncbi:biotin--[acetyl-CoA-carboxylase] ligase [Sandarakinorhabdus sp.]|uniref:biotin--[acetyl-CoA-carboxylase] ligase n=1 Tax=Sandarakinorhabdus sp. TaxID=1916663 RepID=UPI0028ADACED|nr:biotin--[acetyl-CoA-carboxylase] ligase [Sandarakinorhabdus sp.]
MSSVTHLTEVGSTNDWLLARAEALPDGHWVITDRQTAGRGRRGRVWNDGAGNFMGSVLVKADGPVQQLSFVAALALHDALAALTGQPARFTLKWPNDVLLDGTKCSGILLERQGEALVIGMGVNLVYHPDATERPATSLAAAGLPVPTPAALLDELAAAFAHWRHIWARDSFAPIRTAWLRRASGVGSRIVARLGSESPEGLFTGLADDGALLMQLDDGTTRAIHAGEVFAL